MDVGFKTPNPALSKRSRDGLIIMTIFVIGPEGSGKTVLLAMLSRYVAAERKDLVLEPVERSAGQYIVAALAALEDGDWPPSTRQGQLQPFHWRFGSRDAPLHEIVLFDAAGQDLRQTLLESNAAILTDNQRSIRAACNQADVLLYLLDLDGFLRTKAHNLRDEHAWMFRTFLTRPEWRKKLRMVALAKADLYKDMLGSAADHSSENSRVRGLVKRQLPKDYTLDHIVDAEMQVSFFAVASVTTKTTLGTDGTPMRVPVTPLTSVGLDNLTTALLSAAKCIKKEMDRATCMRLVKATLLVVVAVMCVFGIFVPKVLCRNCQASGVVQCQKCGGKGRLEFSASPQCDKCDGTGKRVMMFECGKCKGQGVIQVTRDGPCGKCKTSGKEVCPICHGESKHVWWKK